MAPADVAVSGKVDIRGGESTAKITITNSSTHMAFFMRVEITRGSDAEEVLPVNEDNYITLSPHESRTIEATFRASDLAGQSAALRLEGYNVSKKIAAMSLP